MQSRLLSKELEARSGKTVWSSRGFPVKFTINDTITYSDNAYFGVALIRGNKNFLSSNRPTKPIKLASNNLFCKNSEPLAGKIAIVSGWGICNNCGGVLIPGQLRAAEVEIFSRNYCDIAFPIALPDHIICAGVKGKQVGIYDNRIGPDIGSPLVIGDELVGLFAYTTEFFLSGDPGYYVNVADYRSWISKKIAEGKNKNTNVD
ncbi:zetaTry [Trypoxylus dichotomus]